MKAKSSLYSSVGDNTGFCIREMTGEGAALGTAGEPHYDCVLRPGRWILKTGFLVSAFDFSFRILLSCTFMGIVGGTTVHQAALRSRLNGSVPLIWQLKTLKSEVVS